MAEAKAITKVERVTLSLDEDEATYLRDLLGRQSTHYDLYIALANLLGPAEDCPDAEPFDPTGRTFTLHVTLPAWQFVPDNIPWRARNHLKTYLADRTALDRSEVDIRVEFAPLQLPLDVAG